VSRYRRVLTRIWEDDKFPSLSVDGRLLFLYHLTSPRSTPFLLYVEGPGGIADALRLPSARLRLAMTEVSRNMMVDYADDGSLMVFLPQALTIPENAPESLNAIKTWTNLFHDLPKTPFRNKCLSHWLSLGDGIHHAFTLAFVKACTMANTMAPIQEQEQEQEQEPPIVPHGGPDQVQVQAQDLLGFLNRKAEKSFRGVPVNLRPIMARLKEGATVEDCRGVIARKVREWKGTEQEKYLRPETLFGATKFHGYLGQQMPEEPSDAERRMP